MITNRPLEAGDLPMLQAALDQNDFHPGQASADYVGVGNYSVVYEDNAGPIGILRYSKSLRLVTVWCDNDDRKRNAESVVQAISDSVKKAKEAGFTEIIFSTNSPKLKAFCETLGFEEDTEHTMVLSVKD